MSGIRLLVCGGRDNDDNKTIFARLDYIHAVKGVSFVMHGGAAGADAAAYTWARGMGIEQKTFSADWKQYGNKAGPVRNTQLLYEGKPDYWIAFPRANGEYGSGTLDMMKKLKTANIKGMAT